MRKSKELHGLAVVDVKSGKKLGTVEELIISPDDGSVLAVAIGGGMFGGSRSFVDAADVRAIGADAITVNGDDVARREDDTSERIREAHSSTRNLVGNKVVTENGALLGTVSDYFIDEEARRVTGLTIGGGLLSGEDGLAADRIMSVGPDTVIVRDEDAAKADEGGAATGWGRG